MQRYKLNTKFLIVLLVLTAVVLGGGYGLWAFQVYRSAPALLEEARKARAAAQEVEQARLRAEILGQANELYRRYMNFRPNDVEAQVEYAENQLDIADLPQANIDEKMVALAEAERMLRNNPIPQNESQWSDLLREAVPQLDGLRERSARTRLRFQLYQDAIDHLQYLVESRESDNPEHHVLWLEAIIGRKQDKEARDKGFELVGYDQVDDTFEEAEAVTPNSPRAYVLLAEVLRRVDDAALADRVMNQLVAANDGNYEAFLERSLYWMRHEAYDHAREDWDRAYELNKEDIDVLLSGSRLALRQERYEEALQLAEDAQELFPDNFQTYIDVARAQVMLQDRSLAVETIEKGLDAIKSPWPVLQLLIFKCDLQLRENSLEDAKETIATLKQILPTSAIPRYFEGRALIAERQWVDGVRVLEEARPGLATPETRAFYPMILPDLDQFRGLAYMQMQDYDLAEIAIRQSLVNNPDQPELKRRLDMLVNSRGGGTTTPTTAQASLSERVEEMKGRPASQQRWDQIEASIQQQIDDQQLDETVAKMLWAEYRYHRGQTAQVHQLLQEVLATDPPLNVLLSVIRFGAAIPEMGVAEAEAIIDDAKVRLGDNSTLRLEQGRLWIIDNADDVVNKLWSLTEGADQWDKHQQSHFYKRLAALFRSIGQPAEADKAFELALDTTPQDVDALMEMFAEARRSRDNTKMQEIQSRILDIVGSQEDSRWEYTEAARLITLAAAGMQDPQLLARADALSESVTEKRSRWNEAFRLRGDVLTIQGRVREAILAYNRALDLGPPIPLAVLNHARLLASRQEYREARRVAELLPESARLSVLGKLYPEILFNSTNPTDREGIDFALSMAAEVVAAEPDNAANQLWYADLLVRRGQFAEAEGPVRKAVELDPLDGQNWVALVRFLVGAKRYEDAEQALREARLVLPEHDMPLLLAQGYALLGRWWQAEREFLIAQKAEPDSLDRMRLLAEFYLGPHYPETREDRYTKAVPYINALLQEDSATANAGSVQWARRKAAEIFARTGDYQNTLKAERLLQANAVDGVMPPQDKLALAKILAVRPEPGSRQEAIDLIEEVESAGAVDMESALLLVQLYWKSNLQVEAENKVHDVVGRFGDHPKVWQTFIALLLANGDVDEAAQYFRNKLEPTLPNPLTISHINATTTAGLSNARTLELGVQIWSKQGDQARAVNTLGRLIPRNTENMSEQDVQSLLRIGGLLVLIEEMDRAGQVFRLFAQKRQSQYLVYVKFVGAYQDVEEAFGYLQEAEKSTEPGQMFPVVQTALSIISARRDEIGDSKDALAEAWLEKALRENPDSTALLGLKADLFEMQKKYAEAQQVYERILATPNFTGLLRARVLNNLAYLLALQERSTRDTARAMELIEEARAIRGPSSDILDTEAVVHMARNNYAAAIRNLELAVTEQASAEMWFHLARARWLARQPQEALTAWERAQDLGIGPEKLNRMEHEAFNQFKKDIEEEQRRSGAQS